MIFFSRKKFTRAANPTLKSRCRNDRPCGKLIVVRLVGFKVWHFLTCLSLPPDLPSLGLPSPLLATPPLPRPPSILSSLSLCLFPVAGGCSAASGILGHTMHSRPETPSIYRLGGCTTAPTTTPFHHLSTPGGCTSACFRQTIYIFFSLKHALVQPPGVDRW